MQKGMKYRVWLIYDSEGARRNADYIRMHIETGKKCGISVSLHIIDRLSDLTVPADEPMPDAAIVRTIRPELTERLERLGIPAFNNSHVAKICNDKGKTLSYVGGQSDIPVIPTKRFENRMLSRELCSRFPDSVIKTTNGHGGSGVFRTDEPYDRIEKGIGSSDFVVQPFISGPGKDIRFYVIGNEIVGAVERQAGEDFRANFSRGGSVRSFFWGKYEETLVAKICGLFSFGLVGIDFLVDRCGNLLLSEIEDVVGARMLYVCEPGNRLLEQYFSFIKSVSCR